MPAMDTPEPSPRLDNDQLDISPHDQTRDMSLDTSMSIREASVVADVTEKTIRRWIKNGRLHAVKLGGQYRITVADLDRAQDTSVQTGDMQRPAMGHDSPRVDMSSRLGTGHDEGRHAGASIDLIPLVDHIADLERQVGQLTETSTMWQIRAMQAEEQLKQLAATVSDEQEVVSEAVESPQSDERPTTGIRAWLRRLLGS